MSAVPKPRFCKAMLLERLTVADRRQVLEFDQAHAEERREDAWRLLGTGVGLVKMRELVRGSLNKHSFVNWLRELAAEVEERSGKFDPDNGYAQIRGCSPERCRDYGEWRAYLDFEERLRWDGYL